LKLLNILEIKE